MVFPEKYWKPLRPGNPKASSIIVSDSALESQRKRLALNRSVSLIIALVASGILLFASPFFVTFLLSESEPTPLVLLILIGLMVTIGISLLWTRTAARMMKKVESSLDRSYGRPAPPATFGQRCLGNPRIGLILIAGGILSFMAASFFLLSAGFDSPRPFLRYFIIFYFAGGIATTVGVYMLIFGRKKD
ncbi:MAG: hypothetical protein AB9819_04435 [Methanomassiliicoccales archaeon]